MSARSITAILPAQLPLLSRALVALAVIWARWDDRHRTRSALARVDSSGLRDIGLTPDRARMEASKPFWAA